LLTRLSLGPLTPATKPSAAASELPLAFRWINDHRRCSDRILTLIVVCGDDQDPVACGDIANFPWRIDLDGQVVTQIDLGLARLGGHRDLVFASLAHAPAHDSDGNGAAAQPAPSGESAGSERAAALWGIASTGPPVVVSPETMTNTLCPREMLLAVPVTVIPVIRGAVCGNALGSNRLGSRLGSL